VAGQGATMRALRLAAFGSWRDLRLVSVPIPEPDAERGVLVRVQAAAVNPVDLKTCAGRPADPGLADRLPLTPGYDVAGEIVRDAGEGDLAVGTRVCGMVGFPSAPGGFAEYVLARPDEVVAIPAGVGDAEAAALPLVGLTAWQALFEHGGLSASETVLVTGGAGGVGQQLIQLAHAAGARVVATASARNAGLCAALGADRVVDYTSESLTAVDERIDLVVNTVTAVDDVLAMPGVGDHTRRVTLVSLPGDADALRDFFGSRPLVHPDATVLAHLLDRVARGALRSRVVVEAPLGQAERALALVDAGHAGGKALLRPAD